MKYLQIMQLRQGDVLFVRVESVPDGSKKQRRVGKRLIIEHGEATGHVHAITAPRVDVLDVLGRTYLVVDGKASTPTQMTHDEHDAVCFDSGSVWQRGYQVEERGAAVRPVTD